MSDSKEQLKIEESDGGHWVSIDQVGGEGYVLINNKGGLYINYQDAETEIFLGNGPEKVLEFLERAYELVSASIEE